MRHYIRRSMILALCLSGVMTTLPSWAVAGNRTYVNIHGGDVHFYGQVVNAACSVTADTANQVVQMSQVRSSDFKTLGSWVDPVPFQIKLEDCNTNISNTVGVFFTGQSDGKDPQVFQTGSGASASKGVGLGIFDAKGNLLVPGTTPPWFAPLQEGNTTLSYMAKYRSTDRMVKAGDASTQVWFNVVYQ